MAFDREKIGEYTLYFVIGFFVLCAVISLLTMDYYGFLTKPGEEYSRGINRHTGKPMTNTGNWPLYLINIAAVPVFGVVIILLVLMLLYALANLGPAGGFMLGSALS